VRLPSIFTFTDRDRERMLDMERNATRIRLRFIPITMLALITSIGLQAIPS